MTTFAQWRSPGRLAIARPEVRPSQYDTRALDHFHAYCTAVARTDRHRQAVAESQQATKRRLWILLIGVSLFGYYYLVERVAQAMSLF